MADPTTSHVPAEGAEAAAGQPGVADAGVAQSGLEGAELGVVVGVDGSEQSISAARWAQREAGARGVPLTLATAYTIPAFWGYAADIGAAGLPDDTSLSEGVRTMLESVAEKLDPEGVQPTLRVEIGDAAGVLIDLSRHAELLVSGARGRGGFLGRLLGSVSSALPGHAHCPVAIIPAGEHASRAADGVPVVVGVDGSVQGRAAALVAAQEAALRDCPLHVVCVVAPMNTSGAWFAVAVDEAGMMRDLEQRIGEGVEWLRSEFPGMEITSEILHGAPAEVLIEKTETARLTVVGTRGMGGFAGALLGSTSQGIAVHAKGPLLVVPFEEDRRLRRREDFGPVPDAPKEPQA